jgi:hypothetical protein
VASAALTRQAVVHLPKGIDGLSDEMTGQNQKGPDKVYTRRRLGWPSLTGLAMFLASLGVPASAAVSPQAQPAEVRETVRVSWSGTGGVKLLVPSGARLGSDDLRLTTSGKYAFAGITHGDCEGLCFYQEILALPEIVVAPGEAYTSSFAQPDGSIAPGLNSIYLLTDGNATLTLTFDDAPEGSVELEPSHSITAHVEGVASSCDLGPVCEELSFGGATRTVTEGWAAMVAYSGSDAAADPFLNPGTAFAKTCVSPEFDNPGGPAQPEEHGCRIVDGSDPDGTALRVGDLVVGNTWVDGANMVSTAANFNAQGSIYLGYQLRQTGAQTQGNAYQRNFGIWIEKGLEVKEQA